METTFSKVVYHLLEQRKGGLGVRNMLLVNKALLCK